MPVKMKVSIRVQLADRQSRTYTMYNPHSRYSKKKKNNRENTPIKWINIDEREQKKKYERTKFFNIFPIERVRCSFIHSRSTEFTRYRFSFWLKKNELDIRINCVAQKGFPRIQKEGIETHSTDLQFAHILHSMKKL